MRRLDRILLLSGGIDSYIAWHYLNKPATIYFPLGTPYTDKEMKVVMAMDAEIIFDFSLEHLGEQQVGEKAYIPYRNLYLAMEASKYSDNIVIAGIKGDDVSDKTEAIFAEFSALLSKLENRTITVSSPFWNMTKEDIVNWYIDTVPGKEQIDLVDETVSCYSISKENYCGACPSCFRKWCALVNSGEYSVKFNNLDLMNSYYSDALEGKYIPERNQSILQAVRRFGTVPK